MRKKKRNRRRRTMVDKKSLRFPKVLRWSDSPKLRRVLEKLQKLVVQSTS